MVTMREAAQGLYGAYRLARLDAAGMQAFDVSIEGYWRSFGAALVALPGYLVVVALRASQAPEEEGWLRFVAIEAIAYVIAWVAYPLAAFYLTRPLNRADRYVAYIVAYNWSNVLQLAVYVAVVIVAASNLAPLALVGVLHLATVLTVLAYQWFIARTALAITPLAAAGIVFIDFVIGFLVNSVGLTLHRVGTTVPIDTVVAAIG